MKPVILLVSLMLAGSLFTACQMGGNQGSGKNELVVVASIHQRHLRFKTYSLDILKALIREIDPDIVLAEIPPDRHEQAIEQFLADGKVKDKRVANLPEISKALLPLSQEMDFEIIPVSAWTAEMAEQRTRQMQAFRKDSAFRDRFKLMTNARKRSDAALKAGGTLGEPLYIHSDTYDQAVGIWTHTYNEHFNDLLGAGGWDNINQAHYAYISKALEQHKDQGKRILLLFGAAHKGWFLEKLKNRDDITLLAVEPFLKKVVE